MPVGDPVPLTRRFSPVHRSGDEVDDQDIAASLGLGGGKTWEEIDKGYRSVILAEAGAGKTFEMSARAEHVEQEGRHAFFIRIEDIDDAFEEAFEIGSAESLEQWLGSQAEAWFYLDSVDEARLDNPRTFDRAIRRFSARIKDAQQRAHVCISSRPYAWRQKSDRELIERHLPFVKPIVEHPGEYAEPTSAVERTRDTLEVFVLRPLEEDDIRRFASHRSVPAVDGLIQELERSNLMGLAGRPFDLEEILDKWKTDRSLGGRRDLLRHSIDRRLGEIDQDRDIRKPLSPRRAREGAGALAAAVVLTGEAGIRIPDNLPQRTCVDPQAVLPDWDAEEVQTLLQRAVFDDVIYGAVRFRHREVRELLAAEWFCGLLTKGYGRHTIEALFFREQYGAQIVVPRLRVLLPWLILDDDSIRSRALKILPEIAVEGGDSARLPLPERRRILADIVGRIGRGEDDRSARDNGAIARIAQPDLTDQALALIDQHVANDDAVFFLGRLVWQGNMFDCVAPLLSVAVESDRGIFARIAAARAVMTCGTDSQKSTLWNGLLSGAEEFPPRLLAELVSHAAPNPGTVGILLESLNKLEPYDRYQPTGLTQALHGLVDRLHSRTETTSEDALAKLVEGLHVMLQRQPFVERQECRVSQSFAWLLGSALHAIGSLVSRRSEAAMGEPALAIMLNAPAVRHWLDGGLDHYDDGLPALVPTWPKLNDALFWRAVARTRTQLGDENRSLTNIAQVLWLDRYWSFGPDSFARAVEWVRAREREDDRLVALSLAFSICTQADNPVDWLDELQAAVTGNALLEASLQQALNPTVSHEVHAWEEKWAQQERERERERLEGEQARSDWIARLKTDPTLVQRLPGGEPGQITQNQYWLLRQVEGDGPRSYRVQGAAWRQLIEEFGEDVALAYREAAITHWRRCKPGLGSEGANTKSMPYTWIFGLAGLQIEATEVDAFPTYLSDAEVRTALRYVIYELNGFPGWLEELYKDRPQAVVEFFETELLWELTNTEREQPMHYLLEDVAVYARWLHVALVQSLLHWIDANDVPNDDLLHRIVAILRGGGLQAEALASLAQNKVATAPFSEHQPYWHAVWVDADPETGVGAAADWLAGLDLKDGSDAAQLFITALVGGRGGPDIGPTYRNFQTPKHLKDLYALMHSYIRVEDDIDRAGGGVYQPELRDHAQDARDALLAMLSQIPGKESYVALSELGRDHPDPKYRPWMAKRAYRRAELDGDIEPWTSEQVGEFGARLTRTPTTVRQLFDLTVDCVLDLKTWLEQGNDSPYRTWQKAEDEAEMRNLIAGSLNRIGRDSLTVSQEPELANSQRVDIWAQNQSVRSPIPVELKLLDKGWSGPKLCERLRNQLAGDYLGHGPEGCGMMLLVWQGSTHGRQWLIDGARIGVADVGDALRNYWLAISNSFPHVSAIEIVVIDLTLRARRSGKGADE